MACRWNDGLGSRRFDLRAASVGRQMTLFGRARQVAAPGARSAVYDCILSTFAGCTPLGVQTVFTF